MPSGFINDLCVICRRTSLNNREERIDQLYEEIETKMKLIGMTAIEDKLQEGVPRCIERLAQAGIKIWMLTGDKLGQIDNVVYSFETVGVLSRVETAENVALSCRLLADGMIIRRIEEESEADVGSVLNSFREEIIDQLEQTLHIHIDDRTRRLDWKTIHKNPIDPSIFQGFGLLLTGSALSHALSEQLRMTFLEVSKMCKSVICCRVTPLQKAQVVDLMIKHDHKRTLAIGDGANDVSMIQSTFLVSLHLYSNTIRLGAHVGIGISGQEGRQAVLASDYSIGQFRFLERLLLVHGRWSYIRLSKFLRYFFYKNFAFTFSQFWFGFYCGFSAQVTLPILIGASSRSHPLSRRFSILCS